MGKALSEMTLEELWELFPIFLVEPRDQWASSYSNIESILTEVLSECPVERISHIGSTSIHGIWAKDIVDVLIEITVDSDMELIAKRIEENGFIRMASASNRVSFNRGYTEDGFAENVYHVHLRYDGDNDELYFRDYLNEHTQVAKDYELMKLKLWKQYEHNRDAYTDAKAEFVKKWTSKARKAYDGRY
ncbi:MAG: GrpB family protein [Lachnospiraceae bacterium]|nr:GrpB family protein [Lachnospiraceae bacterium]